MKLRNSLLAGVVLALCAAPSSAGPQPPAGWTDGYVVANGIRIHYWRTGGNKPALVMAHGSSDDALCWTNLAREFQDQYDIVMFDARGHGLSDPPSPSDPPDVQVEDLAGLIKELKLARPILMGHSMGSSSVARFAAKYPDVARGVILEDPGLVRPATPAAGAATQTPEQRRMTILARNNTTEEELVAGCMKNSRNGDAPSASSGRLPSAAIILAPSRTFLPLPPVGELFPKITAPTLIIKADAQGDLRKQNEDIAGRLPRGKIVHIEGAGHNVRRENKAQTIEVMKAFLSGT